MHFCCGVDRRTALPPNRYHYIVEFLPASWSADGKRRWMGAATLPPTLKPRGCKLGFSVYSARPVADRRRVCDWLRTAVWRNSRDRRRHLAVPRCHRRQHEATFPTTLIQARRIPANIAAQHCDLTRVIISCVRPMLRHQSNGQRQSATHRPAVVDCRALLPMNAGREDIGVGTRPCMHLHNLPLSDPLLTGAFHFQRCPGRATIPSGGFSARVPPGRRSAFTQCEPRRSSFAALIRRQPNQR